MNKTKNTGLFISRSEPPHNGHLSALTQSVEAGITDIIYGIGSADKERTQNDPFSLEERMKLVQALISDFHTQYPDVSVRICPIMDFGNNTQWKEYIENELPDFDTIITGNPVVMNIWSDKDSFSPSKADIPYRGTHIRHQIGQGNRQDVSKSVSQGVVDILQSIDATSIIQDINKLQPQPTRVAADVVLMHEGSYVLIRRKFAPLGVALPGGMLDPSEQLHECALREGVEELFSDDDSKKGLRLVSDSPLAILDKPNRDPRGRVISFVYEAQVTGGTLQGNDDAEEELLYISPDTLEQYKGQFAFGDHYDTLITHRNSQ